MQENMPEINENESILPNKGGAFRGASKAVNFIDWFKKSDMNMPEGGFGQNTI